MESQQIDKSGKWVYLKGNQLFTVNSEDNLVPLLLRVITERQFERLQHLEQSYRKVSV